MSLYTQSTESGDYANLVASIAPQTLSQLQQRYLINRALYLGLPISKRNSQGSPNILKQPNVGLRARLAARGTNVATDLAASERLKAYVEAEANAAIAGLGGVSSILPTREWAFILPYISNGVYSLPSIPFSVTPKSGPAFNVAITVNTDGSATVAFTNVAGAVISPDPM